MGAVLAGGREKLPSGGLQAFGPVPVLTGSDPRTVLDRALRELTPDAVLDLSDEPVLDYRRRHQLAGVALFRGVPYEGADFRFTPPARPSLCAQPSMAVVGTGKRTGKTAVAGFVARTLSASGRRPVVVAMGRGGPASPEVVRGDQIELTPRDLLALADEGRHAASDYIEDAMLGRVPTVGCRRCGGGLAGGVEHSNVAEGVALANDLAGDFLLLEGSGSALPPARADVMGLVVPAGIPEEHLAGYFGPYRLLLADFVVVTMSERPFGAPPQVSALVRRIRDSFRLTVDGTDPEEIRVVRTVFRPTPLRPVSGARVFVATTAPEAVGEVIRRHLEREHGCEVAGMSHALSNRDRLDEELGGINRKADVLLCEIKAAAIDVATRRALDAGLEVVYLDNQPIGIEGDDVAGTVEWAAARAEKRFAAGER
ncbi:cyclic 2,3-diphosphoglycerate synthase [soil metagenome]